jgi:hypothetical protein
MKERMKFDFENLVELLRKRADDPAVLALISRDPAAIERSAHLGYVTFRDHGVSLVFREAPWVIPKGDITDPKALYLGAFHFHREGHEGHSQFSGRFPGGVAFGDSEAELIRKLGPPMAVGGGGFSKMLKKPISRWLRYSLDHAILQFQLDQEGNVEMVTLYTPNLQQSENQT